MCDRTENSQNVKNRTTPPSSNHTKGNLPKGYKSVNSKGYTDPNVYSSFIYNSQEIQAAQVPSIDEW